MLRVFVSTPMGSRASMRTDGNYTPEVVEDLLRRCVDAAMRVDRASADIALDAAEDAEDNGDEDDDDE